MFENDLFNRLLILAVLAIWPVYLLIKAEYRRIRNNNSPEITVNAAVVKKSVTDDNIQYSDWYMRDSKVLYGNFLLENGEEITLTMTSPQYGSVQEGDSGTLIYQGTKMVEFRKE